MSITQYIHNVESMLEDSLVDLCMLSEYYPFYDIVIKACVVGIQVQSLYLINLCRLLPNAIAFSFVRASSREIIY